MPYAGEDFRNRLRSAQEARMQAEIDFDMMNELDQDIYEEWLASQDADGVGCACGHELHGKHDCPSYNCPCQQSYIGYWSR